MRTVLSFFFLLLSFGAGLGQEDLGCDLKKPGYSECQEREWRSYLGKYVCLLDHVAGIQYEDDLGKSRPYVGGIKPIEDKFFMEISEFTSLECGYVFASPPDEHCKTKYKMTVKSKNVFLRSNGYSALLPQTFTTTGGQIVIVAGGRLNGNYRFGWNDYVFDGRCEKLN